MAGLKDTFEALADSMYESIFTDFMSKCVFVDTSAALDQDYDVTTGSRGTNNTGYLISKARFVGYTDKEKAKNPNITELDMKCSFRVSELSSLGVDISVGSGLIIDEKSCTYSIENVQSNGITYKLRIRKIDGEDSGSDYSYLML